MIQVTEQGDYVVADQALLVVGKARKLGLLRPAGTSIKWRNGSDLYFGTEQELRDWAEQNGITIRQ